MNRPKREGAIVAEGDLLDDPASRNIIIGDRIIIADGGKEGVKGFLASNSACRNHHEYIGDAAEPAAPPFPCCC